MFLPNLYFSRHFFLKGGNFHESEQEKRQNMESSDKISVFFFFIVKTLTKVVLPKA